MKKVLLFGSAILVATSVLAFGGGGKSRQSSIYRGTGVDSIGIHFNGKDGDSPGETCPAEKQCGDYCCQGDNVCNKETNQCCNESIPLCCNANQTATRIYGPEYPICCDGVPYCKTVDPDGNCAYDYNICCSGEPYVMHRFSYGDNYGCCQGILYKNALPDGGGVCCSEGTHPHVVDDYYSCCQDGQTGYCRKQNEDGNCLNVSCCAGAIYCFEYYSNGVCKEYRCNETGCTPSCVSYYGNNVCRFNACCPEEQTPYCQGNYCGESGQFILCK